MKGQSSPPPSPRADVSDRLPMRNNEANAFHKRNKSHDVPQHQNDSFYVRKMSQEYAQNLAQNKSAPKPTLEKTQSSDLVKNISAKFESKGLKRAETADVVVVEENSNVKSQGIVKSAFSRLRKSESASAPMEKSTIPAPKISTFLGIQKKIPENENKVAKTVTLNEKELLSQDVDNLVGKNLFEGFSKPAAESKPAKSVRRSISSDIMRNTIDLFNSKSNQQKESSLLSSKRADTVDLKLDLNDLIDEAEEKDNGSKKPDINVSVPSDEPKRVIRKNHVRAISTEFDKKAQEKLTRNQLVYPNKSLIRSDTQQEPMNNPSNFPEIKTNEAKASDVPRKNSSSVRRPVPSLSRTSLSSDAFVASPTILENLAAEKELKTEIVEHEKDEKDKMEQIENNDKKSAKPSTLRKIFMKFGSNSKAKSKEETLPQNSSYNQDQKETENVYQEPASEGNVFVFEELWRLRREVLQEMLETEESYLRDLDVLNEAYIIPLQNKASSVTASFPDTNPSMTMNRRSKLGPNAYTVRRSQSIQLLGGSKDNLAFMKSPVVAVLFSNLQHIRKLNSQLFRKMKEIILLDGQAKSSEESIPVAEVFLSYAPLFKLYCEYAKGYEQVTALLKQYSADSSTPVTLSPTRYRRSIFKGPNALSPNTTESIDEEEFNLKTFLDQAMNSPLCMGKPIQSYLILPIQRVPRYELLLNQLLKVSPDGHPDKTLIPQAISEIHKAVVYTEFQLANMELRKKLREIEDSFQGSLALIDTVPPRDELRKLTKKGPAKCAKLVNKSRKDEAVILFLFDDFIVISTPISESNYKMMDQIFLIDCALEEHVRSASIFSKSKEDCAFSVIYL
jgi:hypothetical protein